MIRFLLLILLVSQLFACASIGPTQKVQSLALTPGNTEKILAINDWRLLGRLSVRNLQQSWLTTLEWKHDAFIDDLSLSTSLGGVVAKLIYSSHGIALSDRNGVLQRTSEEELTSLLGYSPPLEHMKYWVRGVPSPKMQVQINKVYFDGVMVFKQDGWDVQLDRFSKLGDVVLPSKVTLTKKGLKIKLVVDKWLM